MEERIDTLCKKTKIVPVRGWLQATFFRLSHTQRMISSVAVPVDVPGGEFVIRRGKGSELWDGEPETWVSDL